MDADKILQGIKQERGAAANIHSSFSAYPAGMKAHFDFYKQIMLQDGPLPRAEREWLAVETSVANECVYCFRHHHQALEYNKVKRDEAEPDERRDLLTTLAQTLSKSYWKAKLLREQFLAAGFTEAEWAHAVMIVSYFNFANRCAHAMDLELETDFQESCN